MWGSAGALEEQGSEGDKYYALLFDLNATEKSQEGRDQIDSHPLAKPLQISCQEAGTKRQIWEKGQKRMGHLSPPCSNSAGKDAWSLLALVT